MTAASEAGMVEPGTVEAFVGMTRACRPIPETIILSAADKVWDRIEKAGPDDCWLWKGHRTYRGYGVLGVGGRKWVATRLVMAVTGKVPTPHDIVCHHCDNPPCCNPAHLYLGDAASNGRDRVERNRQPDRRGQKNPRCKLTPTQVREIRASTTPARRLAKAMGVSARTIRDVQTRRNWSHIA